MINFWELLGKAVEWIVNKPAKPAPEDKSAAKRAQEKWERERPR